MVQVLVFRDVLMRDQEQNHLALLILYGHNVQQTPELGPCSWKKRIFEVSRLTVSWYFSVQIFGLTALLVQDDLGLELAPLVQGHLHLRGEALTGLAAVQEVANAALLHQLAAGEAGQLAEAVRAVDDGIEGLDLSVAQDKVTVWMRDDKKEEKMDIVRKYSSFSLN